MFCFTSSSINAQLSWNNSHISVTVTVRECFQMTQTLSLMDSMQPLKVSNGRPAQSCINQVLESTNKEVNKYNSVFDNAMVYFHVQICHWHIARQFKRRSKRDYTTADCHLAEQTVLNFSSRSQLQTITTIFAFCLQLSLKLKTDDTCKSATLANSSCYKQNR